MLEEVGAVGRRLVGVGLHLAQRDGSLGERAITPLDRIAGVLPALVGEAVAGEVDVLEEAVAVRVTVVAHPAERCFKVGDELAHIVIREPPAPRVVKETNP